MSNCPLELENIIMNYRDELYYTDIKKECLNEIKQITHTSEYDDQVECYVSHRNSENKRVIYRDHADSFEIESFTRTSYILFKNIC